MYTLRRTGVKGCIINYDKTSLIELFGCMNDFDKYNCQRGSNSMPSGETGAD